MPHVAILLLRARESLGAAALERVRASLHDLGLPRHLQRKHLLALLVVKPLARLLLDRQVLSVVLEDLLVLGGQHPGGILLPRRTQHLQLLVNRLLVIQLEVGHLSPHRSIALGAALQGPLGRSRG